MNFRNRLYPDYENLEKGPSGPFFFDFALTVSTVYSSQSVLRRFLACSFDPWLPLNCYALEAALTLKRPLSPSIR